MENSTAETHHLIAQQFEAADQQREAALLGMWVFLATEIMFFGGLFAGYTAYRFHYGAAWAEASRHLNVALGAINTAVLLTSSLTMALAVRTAQTTGRRLPMVAWLLTTAALGVVFLGIKGFEYLEKVEAHLVPGASFAWPGDHAAAAGMFFYFYFALTGLHALHMIGGVTVVLVISTLAWRGRFQPETHTPLEVTGLYWHFVDIVWIFLFPLLYLISHPHG
jgi:cytochrome c oxidase subunit III